MFVLMATREVDFSEEIKPNLPDSTPGDDLENESEELEETDTPSDSSPENKETDSENESEDESPDKEEPSKATDNEDDSEEEASSEEEPIKEVAGETPRERALRLEITKLRKRERERMAKNIVQEESSKGVLNEGIAYDKLPEHIRERYSEEDLKNFGELFDTVAGLKGLVNKQEIQQSTYQQQATSILDDFLEKHPEYLPENDKNDILWSRFQEEVSLYRKPDNPQAYKQLFDRVHQSIFGSSSDNLDKIKSQKAKIKAVSHSNNPPVSVQQKSSKKIAPTGVDPVVARQFMKGFDEEDLKDLGL